MELTSCLFVLFVLFVFKEKHPGPESLPSDSLITHVPWFVTCLQCSGNPGNAHSQPKRIDLSSLLCP